MPLDVAILVATAVLAVVAVSAAVVAVRAARRVPVVPAAPASPSGAEQTPSGAEWRDTPSQKSQSAPLAVPGAVPAPAVPVARVVEGRVVVVPTSEQVAVAALTRPSVRFTTVLHGVAHALRPESRDRIAALVRREYRERRRIRQRAGRRAARAAHAAPAVDRTSEHWLGELPPGRGSDA